MNKLQLPDPERALAATGYERGTIVPIGSTTDWPIYADERIVGERIAMGAGAHGYSLFVEADDLIAAYGATVADISQPIELAASAVSSTPAISRAMSTSLTRCSPRTLSSGNHSARSVEPSISLRRRPPVISAR